MSALDFVRLTLGHEPRDARLFELALTHASVGGDSYERLEFLGDRVLGMVIARALYERYPKEPEGNLSRRYNALVARETCAEIGRDLGVPALVRLGKQAREDRAGQSENVVGDVVESLIGALLLDGGLGAAETFILEAWGPYLDEQVRAPEHPKSALQELAAARGLRAPVYEVVSRTGAHHAPVFKIRVFVAKLGEATAEGSSKQDAETAAAEELLQKLANPTNRSA
jgi:ribonuclease-3